MRSATVWRLRIARPGDAAGRISIAMCSAPTAARPENQRAGDQSYLIPNPDPDPPDRGERGFDNHMSNIDQREICSGFADRRATR